MVGGVTGGVTAKCRATICTAGEGVSISAAGGGNCLLGGVFLQAGVVIGFKGTRGGMNASQKEGPYLGERGARKNK
jgi:hypothetical protein